MEPSGTAPESSPLITCAFIVIASKLAKVIWAFKSEDAMTKTMKSYGLALELLHRAILVNKVTY